MPASRAYCVTYNNPPADFELTVDETGFLRYAIWQIEEGANGTRHAQIYLELSEKAGIKSVQDRLFGGEKVHCEARKGTRDQARDYCRKEDTRVPGTHVHEVGNWNAGGQGARSDLLQLLDIAKSGGNARDAWEHAPMAMARAYKAFDRCRLDHAPKDRVPPSVTVYYGPGGTGKTRKAEEELSNPFRKEPGDWWDGYDMHSNVLVDDVYAGAAAPYSVMLRILDRYPCSVQIKGGTVPFVGEKIILTSNLNPLEWYPSVADKWPLVRRLTKIIRFHEDGLQEDVTETVKAQARASAPANFSALSQILPALGAPPAAHLHLQAPLPVIDLS